MRFFSLWFFPHCWQVWFVGVWVPSIRGCLFLGDIPKTLCLEEMSPPTSLIKPALSSSQEFMAGLHLMVTLSLYHHITFSAKFIPTLVASIGFFYWFMAIVTLHSVAACLHVHTGFECGMTPITVCLRSFFDFKSFFAKVTFLSLMLVLYMHH